MFREKGNQCHRALAELCRAELPMAVKHKVLRRSHPRLSPPRGAQGDTSVQ